MVQLITQFGQDSTSSGIGALGISGQALLIQLITFVLAYLVLRRYAFQPILKVLQERRQLIESGVKLGEDMQKERADLNRTVTSTLNDARRKADGIMSDAQAASRDAQREAEDKARQKAELIMSDAHTRAEQDIQQLRGQLQQEMVGLVSEATEAIIDEKVDANKDAALIDRALKNTRSPSSNRSQTVGPAAAPAKGQVA